MVVTVEVVNIVEFEKILPFTHTRMAEFSKVECYKSRVKKSLNSVFSETNKLPCLLMSLGRLLALKKISAPKFQNGGQTLKTYGKTRLLAITLQLIQIRFFCKRHIVQPKAFFLAT